MKKLLIISILALSSLSFGATALEQSLMNLDQQLQKLDQMEQQKFNQQKALADAAQGRLDKYREMDATIEQRIADIKTNAEVSVFGDAKHRVQAGLFLDPLAQRRLRPPQFLALMFEFFRLALDGLPGGSQTSGINQQQQGQNGNGSDAGDQHDQDRPVVTPDVRQTDRRLVFVGRQAHGAGQGAHRFVIIGQGEAVQTDVLQTGIVLRHLQQSGGNPFDQRLVNMRHGGHRPFGIERRRNHVRKIR